MVTAELAVGLPVLVLLVAFAVSAVSAVDERARLQDAALAVARAYARGDAVHAPVLAHDLAPGSDVEVAINGSLITVTATRRVSLGPGVPSVTITANAVAALEPGVRIGDP